MNRIEESETDALLNTGAAETADRRSGSVSLPHQSTARKRKLRRQSAPGTAGIDMRHPSVSTILPQNKSEAKIVAVDFDQSNISVSLLDADSLKSFLAKGRDQIAHSKVRWINVESVSFDAMQILALHYDMHPLAVEDVFHLPQRIKADFFEQHVYVSMLIPLLKYPDDKSIAPAASSELYHALTPVSATTKTLPVLFSGHNAILEKSAALSSKELEILVRPDVYLEEASFFLCGDGVILSFWESCGRDITDAVLSVSSIQGAPSIPNSKKRPLSAFINSIQNATFDLSRLTILRKSADASLLMHALMDGVVDSYFEITDFYETQLNAAQSLVLERPKA
ncbi:hypothetical protein HK100_007135, partial [Physocladia obscura]